MNLAPHPFTLRQLQYVVAVADSMSFRKAAEQCHVSQPSLSAQIAQLEGVLDVQLFERDRKRVLLTAVGMEVVELARRLLVEVDAVMEVARRAGDPLSGTLRLGVIPTVSPYLLPAVAPVLRKQFPRLTLRWLEDKTEVLARELARGVLDAALVALEADLGDVESVVLADDPFFLVTPKDHPLGLKKGDATPSELRGQDVLLLDEGHCFREQALSLCAKARAHELEFRATSLPTLTQMIASGAGVTLLPALAVATEAKRSDLRMRPFAAPAPKRTLVLIWRKRSPFSGAFQQVAGAMKEAWPRN
jgi:LysR family hydrogen peroxide-inducible transcriptional activator